jgi:predicted transcriptional regulator
MRHGNFVMPTRDGKNNNYDLTDKGRVLAELVGKLIDGWD